MSDALKLGVLIEAGQQRDAVHIAVAPVIAAERLSPGDHIGFVTGDRETVGVCKEPIGIVDPFLKTRVVKDERFWMFLYPQSITSLRHDWTHPAFAEAASAQQESFKWLEGFADELDLTYQALMLAARDFLETGDVTVQHGSESWRDGFYGHEGEFWKHYENATGTKVKDHTAGIFCCTC